MMGAITSVGFTRAATAHQPWRISGSAQNMATTTATNPSTISSVTAQSPRASASTPPTSHGRKPYGNVSASPCPSTGMWNGRPPPERSCSATHHTWP